MGDDTAGVRDMFMTLMDFNSSFSVYTVYTLTVSSLRLLPVLHSSRVPRLCPSHSRWYFKIVLHHTTAEKKDAYTTPSHIHKSTEKEDFLFTDG